MSYKINKIWEKIFKKTVYSCSISNLIGDEDPEVIGCSFDETMRVFDLKGTEIFVTKFSAEITSFIAASITDKGETELLSGDINGCVRLLGKQGELLWYLRLKSPVICFDVGDFTGDNKKDVIIGLENEKLILVDNSGEILEEFKLEETIIDCAIGEKSEELVGKLFVLLKSGKIVNLNKAGQWQEIFIFDDNPSTMKIMGFKDNQYFLIGTKQGYVKVLSFDGTILTDFYIGEKIRCVNHIVEPLKYNLNNIFTVAAGESIYLLELIISKKKGKKKSKAKKALTKTPAKTSAKKPIPTTDSLKKNEKEGVKVLRGGTIEGDEYVFKIKVVNEREYNITDVNIQILSYPSESLMLYQDESRTTNPDRVKIQKITKNGFISPTFIFKPKRDCIKGTIKAVVNYLNEKDEVETIVMEPYELRVICGLLKPKQITSNEFKKFSEDLISFKHVGEELEVFFKPSKLFEKLYVLLEKKNFYIIDHEKQSIGGSFFGVLKAFAEGSFSKNQFGLQITLTGKEDESKSLIKIETFTEDQDMSPTLIGEIEDAVAIKNCPFCNSLISYELQKRIIKGKETFCEACGENLTNRS